MELVKLIFADICRDGGSYEACFETDDGRSYNVWLQRSKMPDSEGLHHRWLFAYFGAERPDGALPIMTGSDEERTLLSRLNGLAVSSEATALAASIDRLKELIRYIERREPCFPSDFPTVK
jgi:hypothetical protein